ncbi:MAG: DNA polymerase II [Candidatus Hydrogenedentota bacterium]
MDSAEGLILSRRWFEERGGLTFEYWVRSEDGPIRVLVPGQESVFFVAQDTTLPDASFRRVNRPLKTLSGELVDALYFRSHRTLRDYASQLKGRGIATFESDVKAEDRYLMERFVFGSVRVEGESRSCEGYREFVSPHLTPSSVVPDLRVASIDIETEGLDGRLYSIGVHTVDKTRIFMVGDQKDDEGIEFCHDEAILYRHFLAWMAEYDPDVLIGWNVVAFDLAFLVRRAKELNVSFTLGRGKSKCDVMLPMTRRQSHIARLQGRVILDGIQLMRLGLWNFESFSLEYVAREMLGVGKLIQTPDDRVEEINRMYREDPQALAKYNLEDCRLVSEIFKNADLLNFAIARSQLTGLALDRQGGSVASFDFQYLPRLHREGFVGPDTGAITDAVMSPGGYVMDSKPGLYQNVLVLDFKSLYPSIIRTFYIDPLGLAINEGEQVAGYLGATFSRETSILPGLIESLWAARDAAKREKNAPLSQAIKIIMNSFYGVLGSTGCRFYDPKLATSITKRGHDLITRTRDFIEEQGYEVIYGDTDSVFVLIGDEPASDSQKIGSDLAEGLNQWWTETLERELDLESHLEIEFETHYEKFFMPTIRGTQKGSKKRYAGLIRHGEELEVQFKGLESVRTDWTPLARRFQREVFRRVFLGEPYVEYVKSIADGTRSGEFDDELVYRKRLRQKIEEYTKNVPPHAQAAKKLDRPRRWVEYVITLNGPEPIEKWTSALDYDHYLDRQLAPAVDGLLGCFGDSFEKLTGKQMEMF